MVNIEYSRLYTGDSFFVCVFLKSTNPRSDSLDISPKLNISRNRLNISQRVTKLFLA